MSPACEHMPSRACAAAPSSSDQHAGRDSWPSASPASTSTPRMRSVLRRMVSSSGAEGDCAVAGALARDLQVVPAGEGHHLGDVVGALREGHRNGVLIRREVPSRPGRVPIGIARGRYASCNRELVESIHRAVHLTCGSLRAPSRTSSRRRPRASWPSGCQPSSLLSFSFEAIHG